MIESNNTLGYRVTVPVVLMVFNRPKTTERVFRVIREMKPTKLLVIADGSRPDRPGESERCAAVRAIVDQIEWDCDVLRNYAHSNMGCAKRVSSGLNWVFEHVEEAIILEDDCVPDLSFFPFCEELLKRYRSDTRVYMISGDNFLFGRQRTEHSYFFSRYAHIWGWATWRRAWQSFDFNMRQWNQVRSQGWLADVLKDWFAVRYWSKVFEKTYRGEINSWAYRWLFHCWSNSALVIQPTVNLVSNIGFGSDATHTASHSCLASMGTQAITFPLCHPEFVIRDDQADTYTERSVFSTKKGRLKLFIERFLSMT